MSQEDQLGLDIYVALNAAGIEGVEPDREDEAEDLLEEAAEIFITAIRNYAIEQGVELSDRPYWGTVSMEVTVKLTEDEAEFFALSGKTREQGPT